MNRYDLTDFEWSVIEPLLPNRPRGVPRVDVDEQTVWSCTPISAATALFVSPTAQRRIMRQRSESEPATRRR